MPRYLVTNRMVDLAVKDIISSLEGRKGLLEEWGDLDEETQTEIKGEMQGHFLRCIEPGRHLP